MTDDPTSPSAEPRLPWAWPLLLALLVAMGLLATAATFSQSRKAPALDGERRKFVASLRTPTNVDLDVRKRMEARLPATDDTLVLRAALRIAADGKLPDSLRKELAKKEPAIAPLYAEKPPKGAALDRLLAKVPKSDPDYDLVTAHARARAGVEPEAKPGARIAYGFGGLFLIAGIGLWIAYAMYREAGKISPRGHPLYSLESPPLVGARLDRVAAVALVLFAAFLLSSLAGEYFPGTVPKAVFQIGFMVLAARVALSGAISPRDVGLVWERPGYHALVGVAVWAMTLPLLVLSIAIATRLAPYLPEPNHPVSDLAMNAGPFDVFGLYLLVAVLAPFWEELFFRGLLFPGLSRLSKAGPLVGAFGSSLLFASFHPQGIALWAGLGTIGAMSCFAVHHTRSLIPSIVLHAVHNGAILTLGLLSR